MKINYNRFRQNPAMRTLRTSDLRWAMRAVVCTLCVLVTASGASGKPPHGGGSGGGLPYATASTVSQLIADINYANTVGGAITINLAPGATFDLKSANNTTDGGNGFPVIGGIKAVNLTIIGNGATIERIDVIDRFNNIKNPFRLFDVASGASLTLDRVTLKGGSFSYSAPGSGGAILNRGALNVINGSALSGNRASYDGGGGGIYNDGGTVTVSSSTLSGNSAGLGGGIYNNGGTVTVSNGTLSSNSSNPVGGGIYNYNGTVTISNSTLSSNGTLQFGGSVFNSGGVVAISSSTVSGSRAEFGGGIYNTGGGTVTVSDNSTLSNNTAFFFNYGNSGGAGGAIYNSAGTVAIGNSTLSGNTAVLFGGGIYNDSSGTVTVNGSILSGNAATVLPGDDFSFGGIGGGLYNRGTVTVANSSSITGNTANGLAEDVDNPGLLYLDGTSTIGIIEGNPAISF